MNIFFLDSNPYECAKMHCDLHVNKMLIESCQMIANCYSESLLFDAPKTQSNTVRKHSYFNHPVSIWVRETWGNYCYTIQLASGLSNEWEHRFGVKHFSDTFLTWATNNIYEVANTLIDSNNREMIKPVLAMPPLFHLSGDPIISSVASYRRYYKFKKEYLTRRGLGFKYTKRVMPDWLN